VWRHERWVLPLAGRPGWCAITDRVSFEPRLPGLGSLERLIISALFRHRHRRLWRRFGRTPGGPAE
jgi:hypothetical protein